LRYLSYDILGDAAYLLAINAAAHDRLVDVLVEGQSSIGAAVVVGALFDSPVSEEVAPLSARAKGKILQLIRDSRQQDLLPELARFVRQPALTPELTILGALTIREVGLPQAPLLGRDPMYAPTREIEQAVYDHFARRMRDAELMPSRDTLQQLRLRLAEVAKDSPALSAALAGAAGVNRNMDLVAAAKLGAVVETLDEIAYGASGRFLDARDAIRTGPIRRPRRGGMTPDRIAMISRYQQAHRELYAQWQSGRLSPREMRVALVNHYIAEGCRKLDQRFFLD
jgi:hypothetical protein